MLGAGIGATTAGKIVQRGRRQAHFIACTIGIIGCGLQMVQTVPTLLVGRTLYGYAGGILSVASNRMVDEYVPLKLFSTCSPVFAVALNVGTLIATFTALMLPPETASLKQLENNTTWRYIFGFPIVLFLIVILGMLIFVKTDTPKFLLQTDEIEAEIAIRQIYIIEEPEEVETILKFI